MDGHRRPASVLQAANSGTCVAVVINLALNAIVLFAFPPIIDKIHEFAFIIFTVALAHPFPFTFS